MGLGLGSLLLQGFHALQEEETLLTLLSGVLVYSVLSLALAGGGLWLARSDLPVGLRRRIAGWTLGFAVVLGTAGGLLVLYQRFEGVLVSHPAYVVGNLGIVGAVAGFVLGVYDARRRQTQERLREEPERVNRLNQRLTVLNRVLRHDLRNGVNVIHAYAEDLLDRTGDDGARVIRDRIEELYELTETARTVERTLSAGQATTAIDLVPVVGSIVREVRASHPAVSVDLDLPQSCHVLAIPEIDLAIEQVVDNAIRHNDAAEPAVRVSLAEHTNATDAEAVLRVADNGPGIPREEVDVFERGAETPLQHSLGTGLWSTNWIVEAAGGRVEIDDRDPSGSVVRIRLPLAGEPVASGSAGRSE